MNLAHLRNYSLYLVKTHGGLPLAARDVLWELYDTAKAQGSHEDRIKALLTSGVNWLNMNQPERALVQFHEALSLVEGHAPGNHMFRTTAMFNLALAYEMQGVVDQSLHYAVQVWGYVEQGGPFTHVSDAALLLGKLHIARANWDFAYRYNLEALHMFEEAGDIFGASRALNNLGLVCIETGDFAQAERLLQKALSLKEQLNHVSGSVYTLTELGRLHHHRGDLASAIRYSRHALQTLWENVAFMDKAEVARLCRVFGSVAARTGDRQGAIAYLQRAITYYAQLNQWREWSAVTQELDDVINARHATTVARVGIEWQDKQILRNLTTLLGLMDTLEGLYPELRGKSELVTKYALILGDACDLTSSARESLSHAARLANVGVTFPGVDPETDEVAVGLGNDGNLGLAERVLSMVSVSDECRTAIRHHHERVDGSGYPDGLKGDEIPIISRILAIADAYVTRATNGDPEERLHQQTMEYLHMQADRKFDRQLVERFAAMHEPPQPSGARASKR